MIGNAYENAIQSSVTIHGTHQEWTIEQNILTQTDERSSLLYLLLGEPFEEQSVYILKMEMK